VRVGRHLGRSARRGERVVGFAERARGALYALLGGLKSAGGALGYAPSLCLGDAGGLTSLSAVALDALGRGARLGETLPPDGLLARTELGRCFAPRATPRGRRAGTRADAEARVSELALQAAAAHRSSRVVVERRSVQGVRNAIDDRGAQLVSIRGEQTSGSVHQLVDRRPLALRGGAQSPSVTATGQYLRLGVAQSVASVEQLGRGALLRADELIDRPCGDRGLAQACDVC
jgi:hypothetical protein